MRIVLCVTALLEYLNHILTAVLITDIKTHVKLAHAFIFSLNNCDRILENQPLCHISHLKYLLLKLGITQYKST